MHTKKEIETYKKLIIAHKEAIENEMKWKEKKLAIKTLMSEFNFIPERINKPKRIKRKIKA